LPGFPAGRGAAVLAAADTDIGIGPQDREHIFDDFCRSPEATEVFREGTGPGLAMARRIVKRHRQTITVESPGSGSVVFRVKLPLASTSPA